MQRVAVLDYGSSNLRSVTRALEHAAAGSARILVADAPELLARADRIVFPGQGAIGQCMQSLRDRGFTEVLAQSMARKPFLGLCLGLQSLLDSSTEDGGITGLGIIPGSVTRFPTQLRDAQGALFKVPHMGWNRVHQRIPHPLWRDIPSGERFYFVHSYYVQPERDGDIAGTTDYCLDFTSAIARDNLFAVQFHPEKSQRAGQLLLRNFLDWKP